MKRDQSHINDLVRQYRNGSISDKDRHHLERIALDDPFLFDSLEGYSNNPVSDSKKIIGNIQSKIAPNKGKVLTMQNMSIAAGFAMLIGGLFWINSQFSQNGSEDFSQVEMEPVVQQAPEPIVFNADTADFVGVKVGDLAGNAAPAELLDESSVKNERHIEPAIEETNTEKQSIPESSVIYTETTILTEEDQISNVNADVASSEEEIESLETEAVATDVDSETINAPVAVTSISVQSRSRMVDTEVGSKNRKESSAVLGVEEAPDPFGDDKQAPKLKDQSFNQKNRTIAGFVRDITGEPLIGANIIAPGLEIGVATDFDGSFSIEVDSSVNQLQIAYIGFEDYVMEIDREDEYNVTLEEGDAVLDEIIVSGYASNSSEPLPSYVLPPDGRAAYKEVIKRMASSGCDQTGKVKLKFTVNKYGEVSDFEIRKGLSESCNQRAVDIIKSSGRWDNQFSKDKKVRYTVSFN